MVAIAQKSGTENSDISQTSSVTLDQNNWDTGAMVTVSAINDPDTTRETTTLEHTVTGADYGGETVGDVMVTVNDDDSVGVTISEPSLTPTEGSNATYTVVLNTQPTGTVTVTATSDNSDVTLSTASDTNLSAVSLEFTSTTWNTAQTVTVAAAEDADAAIDSATITHAVSGAEYATAPIPAPINVTVTENDVLDIDVMPPTLGIDEVDGGTGTDTYTVELKAAPTGGSVTIQINVTGDDNVMTTPSSLTFSASEWTTPTTASVSKTVTVNVSDDPDATSPETATIEHPVSGSSDYATGGIAADDVVVTVTDTDTRGVTLSSMDVTVAEGSTNTYTLVLGTQPTGDVLVTIIDPTDNDVFETDPASLTFTVDNWNSPQTVTVRALPDDDANDDTGTVTHGVSGADYSQTPAITVDDVMVTSTDGDTRGVEIVVTADPYLMGEGETITYQIRLQTEPSGEVTITPRSTNGDISFDPTSSRFDSGNWNLLSTVHVTAEQDVDAAAETATVTHDVSGADYGADTSLQVDNVELDIADDEAADIVVLVTKLDVTEGASSGYTITLGSRPVGGEVTIALEIIDNPDITVDKPTSTFTVNDWNVAQLVAVSAAHDADTRVDRGTIRHQVNGANFTGARIANIAVTVNEDDVAMITIEPTEITIGEGSTTTYTVVLGTEPSGNVTIRATSDNRDVTLSPSTLTFKPSADPGEGQWDEPHVITATASDDSDATNDAASINHIASGHEYQGESGPTVAVLVVEDGSDVGGTSSFLRSSSCDRNLWLTWNAPVGDGTIDGFVIQWAVVGSNYKVSDSQRLSAASTSWLLRRLRNGVEFKVRAQALDDIGTPLWSREITAMPSGEPCVIEVKFGNILADSAPVIVEVEDAAPGTMVNMRYRSLNPGKWSQVLSQTLGEGETSATFDIRGLKPESPYEVQTWLGSQTPPRQLEQTNVLEASAAQVIFTTGLLPEGSTFTGGGGGSRGGRILRIEPGITSVTLSAGDTVLLSVDVWGRQEILDNGLADKHPRNGRPEFTWTSDGGGSLTEANIRSEWKNGLADDRVVDFTAPSHGGTMTLTASLDGSFDCLAAQDDESLDDQTARCSAQIEVTVVRRATAPIIETAPVNPPGAIPETLSDADGVAYAVFTPVDGGSFVGEGFSLVADAGAVSNGEYIGVSMAPAGDASNLGMTWHRYTLGGQRYAISVIDADRVLVSDYALNKAVTACAPLPSELRGNIADIVLAAADDVGGTTVLSTSVKITPSGVSVCGKLSTLPATVAVGKAGSPPEVLDPSEDDVAEEPLPDTGGFAPVTLWLVWLTLAGMLATAAGLTAMWRRRRPRQQSAILKIKIRRLQPSVASELC